MAKKFKSLYKKLLTSPVVVKLLAYLVYFYGKLVWKTCKWDLRNHDEMFKIWDKEGSIIIVGWHGRIAMLPFIYKKYNSYKVKALVSLHKDGVIMANFLKVFKIGIIGGSSSTNSKGAALSLMNAMKNKESICIIPDGPQGPSMVMTSSPIYYAKKSQKPIICSVYSVENSKIMKKTWDNMLIPRPFSRGIFQAVGPYYIPEDATDADINEYAKKIEEDMNNVLLSIDKELGLPKVEIGKVSRKKQKKLEKEK